MMCFFREVVEGDEFLSLSIKQVIQLIQNDKLIVPNEEEVMIFSIDILAYLILVLNISPS